MITTDTDIAVIKEQLKNIKADTTEIKQCLFGNGRKGLKSAVNALEIKFWILLILLIPLAAWGLQRLLGGK